jgi:DNA-directed RNA polymerase specialized sigma24 family protein
MTDEEDQNDAAEPDLGASPERLAVVHAACKCIERMPPPCPTVAVMAFNGAACGEIADSIGISASRVSQHRAAIRKLLERHL